jgi:hypothetical protein
MRGSKPGRVWVPVSLAAACVLLAAGCSSSPSAPPGDQAAQNTRIAVATEYWKVMAVIYPEIFTQSGAGGYFSTCQPPPGHTADQVAYNIKNDLLSLGGRLAPDAFTTKLAQLLQTHGWSAFTAEHGSAVGSQAGYSITLQPVKGNAALSAVMTLTGPCVAVTTAFASAAPHITTGDTYPDQEVSASPLPSSPLPSP